MIKKRLIWHIYRSYVVLSALAMGAVAYSAARVAGSFHYEQTEKELISAAYLLANRLESEPALLRGDVDALCDGLGAKTGYRITVVLPSGTVVGDSEMAPSAMDNHGEREEILAAVTTGIGRSTRYSATLRQEMLYVAVPLKAGEEVIGTVRCSLSLAHINRATRHMAWQLVWDALLIALVAMIVAFLLSRRISRPLERIRLSVESFGDKGLYGKLPSSDIVEVDILTNTLNEMADQLNRRINTIKQQHEEQATLLSCMVESVLAVDAEKNLIRVNTAAERLFNIDTETALGRNIMEVVRNADLLELVNCTLASSEPQAREIFISESHSYLQGDGSVLFNAKGNRIGAVIVLNDITEIRRMERIRRDFVADVSHELRTPITSILGFAEALRHEVVADVSQRQRSLDIIYRQSTRLQAIVEDLLSLSSIENETERGEIELEEGRVIAVIQSAVQVCETLAIEKKSRIRVDCPENLGAKLNAALLQQAIANLINNALKFSESDLEVRIIAKESDGEVVIEVRDEGPGIAREHHSRLFERFYRVDKSRSRKLGGTGLGLAIVKHIVIAHHGRVTVKSELGQGSAFFIHLPKQ